MVIKPVYPLFYYIIICNVFIFPGVIDIFRLEFSSIRRFGVKNEGFASAYCGQNVIFLQNISENCFHSTVTSKLRTVALWL